jgi:two-component system cell cycle response regulator
VAIPGGWERCWKERSELTTTAEQRDGDGLPECSLRPTNLLRHLICTKIKKVERDPSKGKPIPPPQLDPKAEAEIFRLAVQNAPSPLLMVAQDGTILVVNEAAERLFGYDASELLGKPVEALMTGGLRETHVAHRDGYLAEPRRRPMGDRRDLVAKTKAGLVIPVEVGLSPVETPAGMVVVCGIIDLSARKQAEKEMAEVAELLDRKNKKLLHLVATDELTSVMSRRAFLNQLGIQIEVSLRHARPLSVLMLDIDHFKSYNDQFGHPAGDEVLQLLGETLQTVARRSDYVGRLGGEEFGIILPETGLEGSTVLAERFRAAVEDHVWPRKAVTVSLGATTIVFSTAVPHPSAPGVPEILDQADRALYRSKGTGRNRVTHLAEISGDD